MSNSSFIFSIENNNFGKKSFKHVAQWLKEIRKFCGEIPVALFGNKVDLIGESKLDEEKILKFVKKNDFVGYYRTSAKTGQNVENAFKIIIKKLHNKLKSSIITP